MSSQVASLTSFLKKSMKQKEVLTYQQKKFNKVNEKVIKINFNNTAIAVTSAIKNIVR